MSKRQLPPSQRPERQSSDDYFEEARDLVVKFQFKLRAAKFNLTQKGIHDVMVWLWTARALEDHDMREIFLARFSREQLKSPLDPYAIFIIAEEYAPEGVEFLTDELPEEGKEAFRLATPDKMRLAVVLGKKHCVAMVLPNQRVV